MTNKQTQPAWPHEILILGAGLGLLLLVFQYATLAKFAVLSPGAGFVPWAEFWRSVSAKVALNWVDGLLLVAILGLAGALVVLEFAGRRLTVLVEAVVASETRALAALVLFSLLAVRYYFAPGQLAWGGDAAEHILYAQITARAFAAGEWPIWTNYLAGGSPFLQFYGFLFFYVTGAVDLLFGDIFTSIKLVAGLAHALSGPAMYLLVRTATRSRAAGIVAGLAYVLCFWHVQQIAVMGRWPLALFYLFLPLPFYAFERLKKPHPLALVGGGWALAGLIFTHPGYAFWACVFFALYALVRTAAHMSRRRGRRWLLWGGGVLMGGLLAGAYLTLPMWLERAHTGLAGGVSLSGVPDPGWQQLFLWSNFRWRFDVLPLELRHWYGGYMGLSLWALALVGLWGLRHRLGGPGLAVWGCLVVALGLVLGYRWLEFLPMVSSLNAGRYLLFAAFFLAFAAGFGLVWWGRGRGLRCYAVALVVMAVDLGTTTFQHPYLARGDDSPVGYPVEMLREFAALKGALPAGKLPGFRLHPTTEKVHPFSAIGWLAFATGIPHMHSLYTESPHAVRLLHEPWRRLVDGALDQIESGQALQNHPEYEFIYGGARLLNVQYILTVLPQVGGQPHRYTRLGWGDSAPLLVSGQTLSFPAAEFARARQSGQLETMARASFPHRADVDLLKDIFPALWVIRISGAGQEGLACDAIVLSAQGPQRDLGTKPRAAIRRHEVENQRVDIELDVDAACFARLAYAHYPHLRVLVDGVEAQTWPTAGGFIALELAAGRHRIELVPYVSPWRKAMLGWLAFLVGISGWVVWRSRG